MMMALHSRPPIEQILPCDALRVCPVHVGVATASNARVGQ